MSEWFAMGGYGAYVWSAFGFAALVLLALLGQSWHVAHRRGGELARLRELTRAARPVRAVAAMDGDGGAGAVAGTGSGKVGK